ASASTKTLLVEGGKHRTTATGGATVLVWPNPPAGEAMGATTAYALAPTQAVAYRCVVTNPNATDIWVRPYAYYYDAAGGNLGIQQAGTPIQLTPGQSQVVEIRVTAPN